MDVLIVTIIACVLRYFKIISLNWTLIILASALAWLFIGSFLYLKFGFLKFYYHNMLGWHKPDESTIHSDGYSELAECKYCGKKIMQDSQGNWF